jgi:lysophospholipase L1-like esterase
MRGRRSLSVRSRQRRFVLVLIAGVALFVAGVLVAPGCSSSESAAPPGPSLGSGAAAAQGGGGGSQDASSGGGGAAAEAGAAGEGGSGAAGTGATGGTGANAGAAGLGGEAGSAGGTAGQAGGAAAGGAGAAAGSGGVGGGAGSAGSTGLAKLGSLVILGDSIGDGGGQGPFYYDLLRADLQALYGNISYQRKANGGSKTSDLKNQIGDLPKSLPGPVAVCVTSGGNDMKDVIAQIIIGQDAVFRAQMGANISQALDMLLAPGRFGAGVQVRVFEGNIYDASDGKGDFGSNNCAFGKGLPAIPSDGYFASWNGEIATRVSQHAQVLADMHAHFKGHGYHGSPSWYASDCTHPNKLGHDQLRRLFYLKITGKALP